MHRDPGHPLCRRLDLVHTHELDHDNGLQSGAATLRQGYRRVVSRDAPDRRCLYDLAVRIGVLGAARIAPSALIKPARVVGVEVAAIAARDRRRAQAFATKFGVATVHDSYADVVADPSLDAV